MSQHGKKVRRIRAAGAARSSRRPARIGAGEEASPDVADTANLGDALRALPLLTPPSSGWNRLSRALAERHTPPVWLMAGGLAICAMTGALLLVGYQRLADVGDRVGVADRGPPIRVFSGPAAGHDELALLVAESRRLENLLLDLPARQALMRTGTASTIAGLEDQIALVDAQLSAGAAAGVEIEFRRALWRERVDLMNALVFLRASEAYRY